MMKNALTRSLLNLVSLLILVLSSGATADPSASYDVRFVCDEDGPTSFFVNGQNLLSPTSHAPPPLAAAFAKPDGKLRWSPFRTDDATWDRDSATWTLTYSWGTATVQYLAEGSRLKMITTVTNGGKEPMIAFWVKPLYIKFPKPLEGWPWKKGGGKMSTPRHEPVIATAEYGPATLAVTLDEVDRPVKAGLNGPEPIGRDRSQQQHAVFLNTIQSDPAGSLVIAPGQEATYQVSVRIAAPGATDRQIAPDVVEAFLEKYPPVLDWPDRRPVGRVFMSSAYEAHQSETNPRGWFNNPKIDVVSGEGRAEFRKEVLAWADRVIRMSRMYDAQGVIVWDIEGQQFPHATSYIGDPRALKELAPEMDAVADEYFKAIRDAGFRVGICIRPSIIRVKRNEDGELTARQGNMGFDMVKNMSDKIKYARDRWGCTLFYLDTNSRWYFDRDKQARSERLPPAWYYQLHKQHPDVLIIPEHESLAVFGATAPYGETRPHRFGNTFATSQRVLNYYPDAFMVISATEKELKDQAKRKRIVNGVKRGDVLFFDAWYDNRKNRMIREVYEEAGKPLESAASDTAVSQ